MAIKNAWPGAEAADGPGEQDEWGRLYIDGQRLPGAATLSGFVGRKIDVKEAPGTSGATLTHLGYQPARLEATVRLWRPEHLVTWMAMVKVLQPRPGAGTPRAFDVAHPSLEVHGIRRAFVERIGLLQPSSTKGVYEAKLTLIEVRPSTAQGAKSTVDLGRDTVFNPDTAPLRPADKKPSATGASTP